MNVIIVTGSPGTGKTTLSIKLAKKLDFHYIDVNKIVRKYRLSEGYDKKRKTKVVDVRKLNRALINEIRSIKKNPIKEYNSIINSNEKIKIFSSTKKFQRNFLCPRKTKGFSRDIKSILYFLYNKKYSNIVKKTIKNKKHPKIINKKIKNGIIIDSHLSHYLPKHYANLCVVTKCDLKVLKNRLKNKKYSESKVRENLDAEIFDICLNEAEENGHRVIVINTTKGINIRKILNKIGGLIDIKKS